ncbi:MAG: hypothetical protein Q9O62_07680 [Ardenticatenia bacterium]|nr:hypothetical protein [Ardenticatenia bacterium]
MSLDTRTPVRKPLHPWLRQVRVAFVPGQQPLPFVNRALDGLRQAFLRLGHIVQEAPDERTDAIFTTAPFGVPLHWRQALLFTARRRFGLAHTPTLYTLMGVTPDELDRRLAYLDRVLRKEPPDPADFAFPGLAPEAYITLVEQGRRGGPILALQRVLQAQAKSIRILLVVGEESAEYVYHFDLVGAYPRSTHVHGENALYDDMALRIVTVLSTRDVTNHQVVPPPIPYEVWRRLSAPEAMCRAARELGKRHFFTRMVRIEELVHVPVVADAVASQYSEGCFATWEPEVDALIATVTGSSRPIEKAEITENELAVIVGVAPDGTGALVRHVDGKRNDPPSSEAVELMDMDRLLPKVTISVNGRRKEVPVVRSKLHGHRGIASYDPQRVEFVPLDPPYYHYLVSCATEAQAIGVKAAFSRSQALRHLDDPRQVVFTVLPGHGVVIAEKWAPDKAPFQLLWEYMDEGALTVDAHVPQGPMWYEQEGARMVLREAPT